MNTAMNPNQNAPFFVDKEVITLTKNGVWMSDETEIDHEQTVRMFARSLKKDAEGYYLQVGRDTKRIIVEDTAYFVLGIEGAPQTGFQIRINEGSIMPLDPTTLTYRPGRLTCQFTRPDGVKEEAKFLHAAYFDLLRGLEEDGKSYYLEIQGKRVVLAKI
jgi:hypothetical protein